MRFLMVSFVTAIACTLLPLLGLANAAHAQAVMKYIVMRVDFQDSGATPPRYSRQEVEQLLVHVTNLHTENSNNTVNVQFLVTDVFRLPKNKAAYNGQAAFGTTVQDALASAPAAVQALFADDVHAIVVLLSQTTDRGASTYLTLNVGANGSPIFVGSSVVGENPGDSDMTVWGRWAHEVGHDMQSGGASANTPNQVAIGGHPSGYNSDFDLMDRNYPGRIGAVSIQPDNQFEGWLPAAKYQTFTRAGGGGNAAIWAVEYDQSAQPNIQAVKIEVAPPHVYYMVSVRRRVRGDDLNDTNAPPGIPDEGVLIERVDEVTNPTAISTVIGRNKGPTCSTPPDDCNRRELWKEGDVFHGQNEPTIEITKKVDADNYLIRVIYNDGGPPQPDVMINPWLSPPGNTWETTDIWVDSPVNGFGVFRYGMWDDGTGHMVPSGNGDDPAIGLTNRVYARVRNVGNAPASNVVVTFEVTDPLGMGIAGASGWALIGKVDSTTFPQLASIPAGGAVDVYVNWKPNVALTAAQMAAGVFYFHSCLRIRIDPVVGETVLANQDGDREQENIDYFQVPPTSGPKPPHKHSVSVRNDDLGRNKDLILGYRLVGPRKGSTDWRVLVNNGVIAVTLTPGEQREIPVEITPGPSTNRPGQRYSVDVFSLSLHQLVNDLDKKDEHNEFRYTGGTRIEGLIVIPTRLNCSASINSKGVISVVGQVDFQGQVEKPSGSLPIMAVGWNSKRGFIESSSIHMVPDGKGRFRGSIKGSPKDALDRFDCMFAGTSEVSSAWKRAPLVRTK
jgi:hypothetical protein